MPESAPIRAPIMPAPSTPEAYSAEVIPNELCDITATPIVVVAPTSSAPQIAPQR
eukprot:CAMPEP_0197253090 /NCGR_PEP_ID=MMETSP1429-20130617/63661_1 /TAXON_ID=49237 /ORGANISM="Chaetoceros  sp., Strain UNC1202" /LENGTH=54 /DNA_ID=CAMNT_0042715651 /DNA_START=52 /DNA_END=216 /DNA_ORIENTATION=-